MIVCSSKDESIMPIAAHFLVTFTVSAMTNRTLLLIVHKNKSQCPWVVPHSRVLSLLCLQISTAPVQKIYEASWGWSDSKKIKQLKDSSLRWLWATDEESCKPMGFLAYKWSHFACFPYSRAWPMHISNHSGVYAVARRLSSSFRDSEMIILNTQDFMSSDHKPLHLVRRLLWWIVVCLFEAYHCWEASLPGWTASLTLPYEEQNPVIMRPFVLCP